MQSSSGHGEYRNQSMQMPLWEDVRHPLAQNTQRYARKPRIPKNPYNSLWLKAYVDALFNDRPLSIYRRY